MSDATAERPRNRFTIKSPTVGSVLDRLTRPHVVRGLWVVGAAAMIGDLVTTVYGLEIGLREQNPVVAAALVRYGVGGLVGLKLVAVAWVAVVWLGLNRRYGVAALAGLIVPQALAVALNLLTILSA